MPTIVKCQRSVATSDPPEKMLFYTRDRERFAEYDMTPEWAEIFGPRVNVHSVRFFADVQWDDETQPPLFICRVPEQGW